MVVFKGKFQIMSHFYMHGLFFNFLKSSFLLYLSTLLLFLFINFHLLLLSIIVQVASEYFWCQALSFNNQLVILEWISSTPSFFEISTIFVTCKLCSTCMCSFTTPLNLYFVFDLLIGLFSPIKNL